jgi:mitochondrial fission protein ELM1
MMRFAAEIERLPKPRVAVLLGGKSQAFRFTAEAASQFGADLAALSRIYGASLLVTPSRRTSGDAIAALAEKIRDVPHLIWDGTGDNPYFAYLGHADFIVVTQDSVNMVTEAAGTGKPVYIKDLPGYSRRQSHFHALMRKAGVTRPFDGTLEQWSYTPVNDSELVASRVRRALGLDIP